MRWWHLLDGAWRRRRGCSSIIMLAWALRLGGLCTGGGRKREATEKITATLPDVMLRPRHVDVGDAGYTQRAMSMMAQALPRRNRLRKVEQPTVCAGTGA